MKLNVLSDLHLGFSSFDRPHNDADLIVLAGDIARPQEAVAWALRFDKPVLYVLGNHEFYGGGIDSVTEEFKCLCADTRIHVLDNNAVVIDGVRFLGTTLWTNFELFGNEELRMASMAEARRAMRDFSRIRLREAEPTLFTPGDSIELFRRHSSWLDEMLATPHEGPTVVITHHAPSRKSIHPRFADSLLNACFVSDADHLLGASRVRLWIHGHTHDSFDYMVRGTRVVCNPRGYVKDGVNENPLFDPNLMIDLP